MEKELFVVSMANNATRYVNKSFNFNIIVTISSTNITEFLYVLVNLTGEVFRWWARKIPITRPQVVQHNFPALPLLFALQFTCARSMYTAIIYIAKQMETNKNATELKISIPFIRRSTNIVRPSLIAIQ